MFICSSCGRSFNSLQVYRMHLSNTSNISFFLTFLEVIQNEIKKGRDIDGKLQTFVNSIIEPKITQLNSNMSMKKQSVNHKYSKK